MITTELDSVDGQFFLKAGGLIFVIIRMTFKLWILDAHTHWTERTGQEGERLFGRMENLRRDVWGLTAGDSLSFPAFTGTMELTRELELDRATRGPRVALGVSPLGDVGQRGWSSWAQKECPWVLRLVVASSSELLGGGLRRFMSSRLRMHVLPPHILWQP